MKVSRLQKTGAMRGQMLSVKTAPSIKLSALKTTTGPKRPMTRNLTGSPMTRGEMI